MFDRFFKKNRTSAGWLALNPDADGIVAAIVERAEGARPKLLLAGHYGGAADALEKVGRELRAAHYRCSTMLEGGQYQMLVLDAPAVQTEELKTAVRWMLKDLLDYHVDDATIDVLAVPVDPHGGQRAGQLFAVAAKNSLIAERQARFTAAKIPLSVIDVPEMAQRNVSALAEIEGRGLAMLSFGADSALFTVTFGGELFLARRLEVSLAELQETDDERRYASFDKLTLLLQRSMDHFERQFHTIAISRLLLAPSELAGIDDYLARTLYTPVARLDLAELLDLEATPELLAPAAQQRFFLAIGAALRHEEVIL